MFKEFSVFPGTVLSASKEKWYKPAVLLRDDEDLYGKLSYRGFFRQQILAETAGGSWTFEEKGFWKRSILITDEKNVLVAEFKRKVWTGKGELILMEGRTLTYATEGFWRRSFLWNDSQRGMVMRLSNNSFSRHSIKIELLDAVRSNPLLPLLAMLGIYIIYSDRRKHAAAGAG